MSDQLQLNSNDQPKRSDGKAHPPPEPTLPQNNDEAGYVKFQSEQAEFFRELGDRLGIALNRRVRIKLKNVDREFEGKLVLAQLLPPASRDEEFRLRAGDIEFYYADIEHVIQLEERVV